MRLMVSTIISSIRCLQLISMEGVLNSREEGATLKAEAVLLIRDSLRQSLLVVPGHHEID